MTRSLRVSMAAVTAVGAVLSAAAPASARDHGHGRWRHHDDNDAAAAAVVGGLLGLAIGAAIVSSKHAEERRLLQQSYYVNPPADPAADATYAPPYDETYALPAPRVCTTESWSWDRGEQRYRRVVTSTPC